VLIIDGNHFYLVFQILDYTLQFLYPTDTRIQRMIFQEKQTNRENYPLEKFFNCKQTGESFLAKFADIALPIPVFQNYTYEIPEIMSPIIKTGFRVLVPVGKRKMTGYVINIKDECDRIDLKPIHDLIDKSPAISDELIRLAKWISDYYICPLGEVIKAMLPGGINLESKTYLKLIQNETAAKTYLEKNRTPRQNKILQLLLTQNQISVQQLRKRFRGANLSFSILKLIEAGLINQELRVSAAKTNIKYEIRIRLSNANKNKEIFEQALDDLKKSAPVQAKCFKIVQNEKQISLKNLLKQTGASSSVITSLIKKKYVEKYEKEVFRSYLKITPPATLTKLSLNEYQKRAIFHISEAIELGKYKTFLVHGVTGSGKTQVYIEAIKTALQKEKTAIVLVPEISLTPQTVRRFTQNFPDMVAVLHSRMSPGERYDSWRKLKQGRFKIAIGPRSAIFAPLDNLGLIVVDEEHESSYKQYDSQPLYHARDVAVIRGTLHNAVVVLGSATPSLESYYNTKSSKYHLLELPGRIEEIPMPKVTIVDMLTQHKRYPGKSVSVFSKPLQEKIEEKLTLGQQIILLQNRRGFSTYVKCKDCGFIEKCDHCEITLTYHAPGKRLRCHYCDFNKSAPDSCPDCGGSDILFKGIGTQKVEQELSKLFPQARVVRMDLDTTSRKHAHDQILGDFARGNYDILLGTQMVAKGLDFQNVTLVGVISADTSLLLPDFRSSERTFQLLTQVAGRAGRKDLLGEVIIQTYSPDNPGLIFARDHNSNGFFLDELPFRRELNYPPFGRLIYVLFKGEIEEKVEQAANSFFSCLKFPANMGEIFGPIRSPLARIQDKYRWQIIIKSDKKPDPSGKISRQYLHEALTRFKSKKRIRDVRITIDIDPISLL
jgi:primosomal protein N' (replication factor Y) (superfamily II helicase)